MKSVLCIYLSGTFVCLGTYASRKTMMNAYKRFLLAGIDVDYTK